MSSQTSRKSWCCQRALMKAVAKAALKKDAMPGVAAGGGGQLQFTAGVSVHAAALGQDPTAMALAASSVVIGKNEVDIKFIMGKAKLEDLSPQVRLAKKDRALLGGCKKEVQVTLLSR